MVVDGENRERQHATHDKHVLKSGFFVILGISKKGCKKTLMQDQFVKSFECETKARPIWRYFNTTTQMKPELKAKILEVCPAPPVQGHKVHQSGVIPGCVKKETMQSWDSRRPRKQCELGWL